VITEYWKVDPINPQLDIISRAAALILDLQLVAFPTETVYGLGALASSSEAVAKIFAAKGRPAENPLLVHVSKIEQVKELALEIPETASLLMDKFWPGPLSIILPSRNQVPAIVRGGKISVGLRMPSHPVARALIDQTGPIAAPSANLSGRPSPLTAEHVKADLDGKIAAVLDAGRTGLGLESTIIDLSQDQYRVLRLGGLPLEKLQQVLGEIPIYQNESDELPHYQTRSQVIICQNETEFINQQEHWLMQAKKLGIVSIKPGYLHTINKSVPIYDLDLGQDSSNLYTILRDAEQDGIQILLFSPLPQKLTGINRALLERIKSASKFDGENLMVED
jgi:L-threonylcarbamoyladenylate synthase